MSVSFTVSALVFTVHDFNAAWTNSIQLNCRSIENAKSFSLWDEKLRAAQAANTREVSITFAQLLLDVNNSWSRCYILTKPVTSLIARAQNEMEKSWLADWNELKLIWLHVHVGFVCATPQPPISLSSVGAWITSFWIMAALWVSVVLVIFFKQSYFASS